MTIPRMCHQHIPWYRHQVPLWVAAIFMFIASAIGMGAMKVASMVLGVEL